MIGRSLGHYRIDRKLGEGGVGVVYRAVDERLDRPVALKVLLSELHARPDVVERFRTEARTLAQLHHPNIATLFGFEETDGELFMVIEFVEGMTLASLTQRGGGLPLEHALPIFFQALEGVGHAHELGIVHRDIKGSNLMLDTRGQLKVMDFGIARIVGSERHTLLGHVVGTPEFMAPEQIRGEEADARSDIYALGSLLFLLLSGRPPFSGGSGFELMRAQVEQTPPSIRERAPDLPEEIEAVVARALEKDPARRIPSCAEFRELLLPLAPASTGSPDGIVLAGECAGTEPMQPRDALAPTRELDVSPEPTETRTPTGDSLASPSTSTSDGPSEAPTHAHAMPPSGRRIWRRPTAWVSAGLLLLGLNAVWWNDTALEAEGDPSASLADAAEAPSSRAALRPAEDGSEPGVDSRAGEAVGALARQEGHTGESGTQASNELAVSALTAAATSDATPVPADADEAADALPQTPELAVRREPGVPAAPAADTAPRPRRDAEPGRKTARSRAAERARKAERDRKTERTQEAGSGWVIRRQ